MKKKIAAIVLIFTLIFGIVPLINISYATVSNETLANELKELGLFLGTGNGYALEKPCDRLMGAVILVRFLGCEDDALSDKNVHPFKDIEKTYANKYIGYLFSKGLIQGQSATNYGTGTMTANQFATLLLRALKYEDGVDFTYNNALSKMSNLGIISSNECSLIGNGEFIRDDVVFLCYKTLLASPKGETMSLANKLLWENVYTTEQLDNTKDGKLMIAADMPDLISNNVIVYNTKDLRDLIMLSMKNNQLGIGIIVPGVSEDKLLDVYNDIISDYHWKTLLNPSVESKDGYIYPHIGISDYLMMQYYYQNPKRYEKSYQFYRTDLISYTDSYISLPEWAEKIDAIIEKYANESMTQKQKLKALHDYLVLNTKYDKSYEGEAFMTPHFAEEVIFNGHGVCDGYAEAFKILMNGAGIDCKVIYGKTPYGLHSWNQVKIDNKWYNIDVTWDDPDSGNKILYNYYCLPDSKFLTEHEAEKICKPESCTSQL